MIQMIKNFLEIRKARKAVSVCPACFKEEPDSDPELLEFRAFELISENPKKLIMHRTKFRNDLKSIVCLSELKKW